MCRVSRRLSYTTFEYSDLSVSGGDTISATFAVKSTGDRAGADLPQLYLTEAADDKRQRLFGFERVDSRLHARYDADAGQWRIAEGTYKVVLGKNAQDFVIEAEGPLTERRFGK